MSNIYEVKLQPGVPQTCTVLLGGVEYTLTLNYRNITNGGWVLDIADSFSNPILSGIPLVTGANLLGQYGYLGFGGGLWAQTLSDQDAVPTFANLGGDGKLYWVTA